MEQKRTELVFICQPVITAYSVNTTFIDSTTVHTPYQDSFPQFYKHMCHETIKGKE